MATTLREPEYKKGDVAYYQEDGEIDKVEVLDSGVQTRDGRPFVWYNLRVLEVVQESGIANPSKIGEESVVEKQIGVYCGGMWKLSDCLFLNC